MALTGADAALPTATQIGPYFSVVSLLPAALLVTYVRWLLATGALTGPMDWTPSDAFDLAGAAVTAAVAVVVALALNPLQFGFVQVLEGYWGASAVATAGRASRIAHHRARVIRLIGRANGKDHRHVGAGQSPLEDVKRQSRLDESRRQLGYYPAQLNDVLPTRLGNVLRKYEFSVGAPYGLELIPALPRIAMVAREPEIAYVQNQRVQLELAVRTCVLSLIAAFTTCAILVRQGWPVLLSAVPYAVAYLAYRGAILLADEYGTAMTVMLELNRFTLYERLALPRPANSLEERLLNGALMPALKEQAMVDLRYLDTQQSSRSGAERD